MIGVVSWARSPSEEADLTPTKTQDSHFLQQAVCISYAHKVNGKTEKLEATDGRLTRCVQSALSAISITLTCVLKTRCHVTLSGSTVLAHEFVFKNKYMVSPCLRAHVVIHRYCNKVSTTEMHVHTRKLDTSLYLWTFFAALQVPFTAERRQLSTWF
jgi:hypothetical protein